MRPPWGGWCGVLAVAGLAAALACRPLPDSVDPTDSARRGKIGLPVLSFQWKFVLADASDDSSPQEFASPATYEAAHPGDSKLFIGSHAGMFYALSSGTGNIVWKKPLGSVSSRPLLHRGRLYVGTDDGTLHCLDAFDGEPCLKTPRGAKKTHSWPYATRGPILSTPVVADDLLVFSNEDDHVYAIDRDTGKFRWQYKKDSPEEYTLRGHAGVAVDGELAFVGFADGTVVALRVSSGSVAWIKSVKGDGERFVDSDSTPLVVGELVVCTSSSGGVFALDKTTGRVRWRLPVPGAGPMTTDDERIYVAAADEGVHAIDFEGNLLWRQGTQGGGEPAVPVVSGDYLLYGLSDSGLFIANKRTGEIYQSFDPGYGVSSEPTVVGDHMFLMSNGAVLYAMALRRF